MKKIALFLVFVALTTLGYAQVLPVDSAVIYGKLDNGLTYYIRHNEYPEKRADFYIAQRVGSMLEEDDQAGLAHFLEHMMFNGTKNYPGKKTMLNWLETVGVKFGTNANAYTSFDETVYNLSSVPVTREGIIDSCLLVLHDWSGFASLTNEQIDEERLIIKEEWRTRNTPSWRTANKQFEDIFTGSKYANRMPIGSMDIVENFPYQALKDYYKKWYRPDLQAVIIVGDVDAKAVEAKLKTLFADVPKPVDPAERVYFPVPDANETIVSIALDPEATRTQVNLYLKHDLFPKQYKKTAAEMSFNILKGLATRILADRLEEISQTADAPFSASTAFDGNYGSVAQTKDAWTTIALSKENKVGESLAVLVRENERVKQYGFTDAEVERAKANVLQRYETQYNNRNKTQNEVYTQEYVRSFTQEESIPGIEFEYDFVKGLLPQVSAQALSDVAKQLIDDKNSVIAVSGPEKEGLVYPTPDELRAIYTATVAEKVEGYVETVSNEPLIAHLPKAGKVVKTEKDATLDATVWTLSNGMKVVLKKTDFKDDQILMNGQAYGGTSNISDADIFNANLADNVPEIGGVGNFSATDLKKALAGKSVNVNASIITYTQAITGSSTVKDAETLLQLTYLYFTAPRKDEAAFNSIWTLVKNQLKNQATTPSFIMGQHRIKAMYGDNPRMKQMTFEDAETLNYDRIIEIYKQMYANPGAFVFTFVGTIDEQALKPLVEQYLASLPAGNKKATYKLSNPEINKGTISDMFSQEMQAPKTTAFELYSGQLEYNQKNVLTISALKQVLDIVFQRAVRDEAGGAYGVGTRGNLERTPAGRTTLQINFDTNPDRAATITPIIDKEIKKIAEQGPAAADFQKVKEYMLKQFQEDEKDNGYWGGAVLRNKYFYNDDTYSNYRALLDALTPADIQQLTKELISQGNFIEVIMNPAE
ncbi:MAG: insulinase family protein [Candidatus Symbiothrix sp.]|jgi:zinc protease|nr:insulinase family protein [Candidatus Symbiothrix sp.]